MKRILAVVLTLAMLVLPVLAAPDSCEHDLMHLRNGASHYDECQICFELFNVGDHTMKDGVCTVCNYPEKAPWEEEIKGEGEHEHIFNKTWDAESHYEECTVCLERFGVGKHTFEDGKCTVCRYQKLINPFIDVKNDAWYAEDVCLAVQSGLVSGKSENEYKPDDFLTYAEAIKLAACMNQKYINGEVTLTNGQPWYQTYVDYCFENDIIRTNYKYGDYTTRVGYMYIFACALPEEAYEPINNVPDGSIPDVPADAPYASVVYRLYRAGIVTGVDDAHRCNPTANIKRSEVAVIISRMMDASKRIRFSLGGFDGVIDSGNADVEISGKESIEVELDKEPENEQGKEEFEGIIEDCKTSYEHESIVVGPSTDGSYEYENKTEILVNENIEGLHIEKNPESIEVGGYTSPGTLEVKANGGRRPYTYQWKYRQGRGDTFEVVDTFEVKGAQTDKLTIYTNPNDKHTGLSVYCTVTDADGNTVNSTTAAVYGPFSMKVEQSTVAGTGIYELVGRLDDGMLKNDEKLAIQRNGKSIAFGVVKEIKMFGKNLDVAVKNDYCGITFKLDDGYTPKVGDVVLRYQDYFTIDASDIVN